MFGKAPLVVEHREVGLNWSAGNLTFDGRPKAPTATATGAVSNGVIGAGAIIASRRCHE